MNMDNRDKKVHQLAEELLELALNDRENQTDDEKPSVSSTDDKNKVSSAKVEAGV